MLKIAIDIMGGDNSLSEPINGIKSYFQNSKDRNIFFYIVGERNKASEIIKNSIPKNQYEIINTSQIIGMNDKPLEAFKTKHDSSMIKCINLLKESKVNAVISSGNTGALLLSSTLIVKKIAGIKKAILAPIIPNQFGSFILSDVGANINLKPNHFVDISKLCIKYCNSLGKKNPSIHLLNIGKEENKGTEEVIETFYVLSKNFTCFKGNIEARDLMTSKLDIVLCNGFTGNIALKLIEGLSHFLFDTLKDTCKDQDSYENICNLKDRFNFELSTLLLGINGIVLKCHGSASKTSFKNAIIQAKQIHTSKLINKLTN